MYIEQLQALLPISLIMGSLSAYLGYRRGKSPYLWFFIGALLGVLGICIAILGSKRKEAAPAPEQKTPVLPSLGWYYLSAEEKAMGPCSLLLLRDKVIDGSLSSRSYVWHETLTDWVELKTIIK